MVRCREVPRQGWPKPTLWFGTLRRNPAVAAPARSSHAQSSRLSNAASTPMPPTRVIKPGAAIGGPMGTL